MLDEPYRPATKLVKWLTILLVAYAVICLLVAIAGWSEMQAADRRAELAQEGEEAWVDAYVTEPALTGEDILVLLQVGVFITLIVLFCLWIPRANRNARALGAAGMQFTPRWCVIWYLIPIMNLFRPYQAMKEIWLASNPAAGWQQRDVSPLLPLWWALWLIANFANQMAYGWEEPDDDPFRVTGAMVFADAIYAPLSIVAMLLVRQIHARQEHSRDTTAFD
ncbi:MAG: DUF4328 domain-containing protein [Planctomycetota bacterium]|jgi:hypothetical protein